MHKSARCRDAEQRGTTLDEWRIYGAIDFLDIYEAQVVNRFFQLIVFSTTSFSLFFEVRQFGLPGGLGDGGKSAPNGAKPQKDLAARSADLSCSHEFDYAQQSDGLRTSS